MLIQLPWAVSTLSHPTAGLIKQKSTALITTRGFKNSFSLLNITQGGTSKVLARGPYPCPNCSGPRALWLGTDSLWTGWALPLCHCHGSATAAAGLLMMPFIYILLIYFRSWKCILNISVKPGVTEGRSGGKSLRMQSGERDGEQQLAPPRSIPLLDSHRSAGHISSDTLLMRCFETLRAPL